MSEAAMVEAVLPLDGASPMAFARAGAAKPTTEGIGFEQALGTAIGSAVNALQTGEGVALQGLAGAAPPMKVVEGVMEAQRSLQSVLAVRDKLVSAWEDISRMSI